MYARKLRKQSSLLKSIDLAAQFCPFVEHLSLAHLGVRSTSPQFIDNISPVSAARITSLDISGSPPFLSKTCLRGPLTLFKNLRHFIFKSGNTAVDDLDALQKFFSVIHRTIVTLDLFGVGSVNVTVLESLSECSRLQVLKLPTLKNFCPFYIRNFIAKTSLQGCCYRKLRLMCAEISFFGDSDEGAG